jgi:hypothetical protein
VRRPGEAFGQLVLPAVFKTDVTEDLGQAGSIPVRLRRQQHVPDRTTSRSGTASRMIHLDGITQCVPFTRGPF